MDHLNLVYFCAIPIMLSAVLVILVHNPVHSVVFLMTVFVFTTIFLIVLGCDFIAFIFLMVYVGAIAVLFLFVVMMLNIRNLDWVQYLYRYIPLGIFIVLMLFFQFKTYLSADLSYTMLLSVQLPVLMEYVVILTEYSNIEHIGMHLFTGYSILLVYASIVLLVAMVGAIVLTLHRRSNLKNQNIVKQLRRTSVLKRVEFM